MQPKSVHNQYCHFIIRRRREGTEERTEEKENEGQCIDTKSEIGSKSEIAWVVQALTSLWLKTHLATSRDCLQKLICLTNNDIAQRSALAWTLAEAGRYAHFRIVAWANPLKTFDTLGKVAML